MSNDSEIGLNPDLERELADKAIRQREAREARILQLAKNLENMINDPEFAKVLERISGDSLQKLSRIVALRKTGI
jgi:hypothetical protein